MGYEPFKPPFPLHELVPPHGRFHEWSQPEAEGYFDWFREQIAHRLDQLRIAAAGQSVTLTRDNLAIVERVLRRNTSMRSMSPEERAVERASMSESLKGIRGGRKTLDDLTISLCVDTGIHFAETLRAAAPTLQWALWTKRDVALYKPVLEPFFERMIPLEPVLVAQTVAWSVAERDPSAVLTPAFDYWIEGAREAERRL